jgi:hypothetical protein
VPSGAVRENTRREYRPLLATFGLSYFDRELHVRDLGIGAQVTSKPPPEQQVSRLPVLARG